MGNTIIIEDNFMIFVKWYTRLVIFYSKLIVAMFILSGLSNFLHVYNDEGKYIWDIISLLFIVGTLVLSIQPSYLKKNQERQLSKNGFLIILAGVIIIISYGFGFTDTSSGLSLDTIKNISSTIFFIAMALFSYSLSDLVIELAKNIFSKK